jgi:hypothetical protein
VVKSAVIFDVMLLLSWTWCWRVQFIPFGGIHRGIVAAGDRGVRAAAEHIPAAAQNSRDTACKMV